MHAHTRMYTCTRTYTCTHTLTYVFWEKSLGTRRLHVPGLIIASISHSSITSNLLTLYGKKIALL